MRLKTHPFTLKEYFVVLVDLCGFEGVSLKLNYSCDVVL